MGPNRCVRLLFLPTTSMATPLSSSVDSSARNFLNEQGIASESHLEVVSNREGRAVCHLHNEGLDYTIKCFETKTTELAEAFERELQFYNFLKPLQTGKTPLLLGCNPSSGHILLTRIAGRGIRETEIDSKAIKEATSFILAINSDDQSTSANTNKTALGACQTIGEHLTHIAGLVTAVQQHLAEVNPQTRAFIEDELGPIWQKVLGSILNQFQTASIDVDLRLEQAHQFVSPGELGFHNAIITPEREICFVDFDQAGYDDPARTICNFFTSGPIPPKEAHWDSVIDAIGTIEQIDPTYAIRARILLPAYKVARACNPILKCLREESNRLNSPDTSGHSKTQLVTVTNRARQWLIRANQGL